MNNPQSIIEKLWNSHHILTDEGESLMYVDVALAQENTLHAFTELEKTGRKVLNVSPGFAEGVFEMGGPAGDALLEEVISYCVDPQQAYFHTWQADDMVLWDNWRVLHCAAGVNPDDTRLLERTTIEGDYGRGRNLDGSLDELLRFDA